ncbi:PREDICTED: hydrocephalus-inducing protein homolog [Ceratosolen solmsi marchali]|uniref:Hydrocephalus-inducing protein homolog n=1 Tax=Ceratosolen solmsi marchali TaxID=326594 RepID=A0AAJ6YP47_9HYME|nr:PREDICTED: hydrocephalus-inducing protein homolog [Ceratosolen solmsi marchali]
MDIPRDNAFLKYPISLGYRAVQLVIAEAITQNQFFTTDLKCSSNTSNTEISESISESEIAQLNDNNWHIVRRDDDYPSQTDIDMAFERLIVKNYIEINEDAFVIFNSNLDTKELPLPLAPAYLINMNFVLVEQTAHFSICLKTYGFNKANVKLIKEKKKNKSSKTFFFASLEKHIDICQCESTTLNVIFSPKKSVFSEERTDVTYKFYLQVKQGLTIPVNVQASAVYPHICTNIQTLNFNKVFTGQCKEMAFLLKNNGFIDCHWEICIESQSKNLTKCKEHQFEINYNNDVFSPNKEAIIKVYFRPYRSGIHRANLLIMVSNAQDIKKIRLKGYGVERNVNINKTIIKFPFIIPNTKILEEYLVITNDNEYPVELYWQHIEDFRETNKVIRALQRYYRIDEILIPQRDIGENLPQLLTDFYKKLINDMYLDDEFHEIVKNIIKDTVHDDYLQNEFFTGSKDKVEKITKKKESVCSRKKKINKKKIEKSNALGPSILSNIEPNAVETLLNAFAEDNNAKDFAKKIDKRYQEVIAKITNTLTKKSLASVTSKLQQFWKQFPTPEELERMDPYSLYEYKFEIIAQGLNDIESLDSSRVYKAKDKENAKNKGIANKKQNILPDVSEQFIQDILRERFDTITDTLMLSINNNDKPEIIQLECNGIELNVELEPKQLNLNRILLNAIEKRIMIIRNNSPIVVYWRISTNTTESTIQLVPKEGKLKYKGCCEIEFQYYANRVGKADTKYLTYQLFLNECKTDPIATDNITITAETYDIEFQLSSDIIDFNKMTVGSTDNKSVVIKNLGPYEIEYKIQYQEFDVLKKFCDPNVISYYTRFSIEPHPILNFGTIALKSTKAMRLKVSNTGKFPLKYSIVNESTTKRKTDPTTNKSDKIKSKCMKKSSKQVAKINTTHKSKWEPFYLDRVAGELDPGQVDMLTIHCSSNSFGHFDEKLIFVVPESLAADEKNRRVSLVANVCPPDIDFKNFNEIFIESHVVDSYSQFICPSESGEHSIFVKTTKCLHFCRVCIGSNYTIYVTLTNISFINGDVIIELLKSNLNAEAFKINTNRLSIPAMSKENFTITFAPTLLGKFSSLLKIKLDLPEDVQLQTFCVDLKGESCMPQICILEPSLKSNEKLAIDFGLSFILEKRQKICRIQNIGQVKDNLIVKLMDNNTINVFGIFIEPDKDDLSNNLIDDKDIVRCLNIPIIPGEIINVRVQFLPKKAKKYINRLTIIMKRNPYETFEIDLLGNGFSKNVIFEYLDIIDTSLLDADERQSTQQCKRKSRRSSINKQETNEGLNLTPLVYKLDYEKCFLNEMNKINFKIVNKTSDRKFRFELNSHPNIVFTPSAGHLAPCIFKEITATFLASEPIILSQMPIDCIVNEIELSESEIQSNWDTRQMTVSWEEKFISSSESKFCEDDKILKKVIRESEEPAFKIISETVQQLQLWIYAIADYSYYSCDTKSIDFDDTLMFQLSFESSDLFSNSADLTNRTTDTWIEGDNWPFRIKPETGSIDPEKSVHFTVNFSPIDVFQYKAYLQCKMENLNPTTQSLNIVINATSLLPYCHFEIQESDYLTSGRRDDKLPFPSGYSLADYGTINKMKIVEFNIMGTGEYYTRHIRLVNPTTEEFSYSFVRLSSNTIIEKLLALQCLSEIDVIASGSRKEISFCMMSEEVGLFESFWQFEIKKYNLTILFLIVINVTEPLISYKNTLVKLATCTVDRTLFTNCDNIIDIGQIILNNEMKLKFKLMNNGQIAFDYSWILSNVCENTLKISISEKESRIEENSSIMCYLKLLATAKLPIRYYSFALQIKYGPTYHLKLHISGKKIPIEFSFSHYNFGPSYIQLHNGIKYSVDLKVTNHQNTCCPLQCTYNDNSDFKVNLQQLSQAIPPNATIVIPIYFQPIEEKMYEEVLHFSTLNESIQANVLIRGQGVMHRICLKNPGDAIINFGTITIGKTLSRKICVANEGCVPVKLKIDIIDYSSADRQETNSQNKLSSEFLNLSKDFCSPESEVTSHTTKSFDIHELIEFSPKEWQNLKQNTEMEITIKFKGVHRVKSLKVSLGFKIDSFTLPLTIVKGNCTMASFYINRTYISFGTIFEGCAAKEKLMLINNGDLGSKKEKNSSYFDIIPSSGYCSANSKVVFTCTFKVNCQVSCTQSQFTLALENHENLFVNVTGNCAPIPEPTEIMNFLSEIHQSEIKEIQIYNDSDRTWYLKPKIIGEYFTTVLELSIDPKTEHPCTIAYKPKKLTSDSCFDKITFNDHQANSQCYNVEFVVSGPKIQDYIELTTYARNVIFHTLRIDNPLENSEVIFDANNIIEDITIHGLPTTLDPLSSVDEPSFTCPKTVSIRANEEAAIDVRFEPSIIGNTNATIKAMSSATGEFIFPIIGQSTLPQPQGPFVVTTREPISINFKNVFLQTTVFDFSLDNQNFTINCNNESLDPKQCCDIIVTLKDDVIQTAKTKVGKLIVTCKDGQSQKIEWMYYLRGVVCLLE